MLLSLPPPALEQPAGVATMGPPLPPDESEVRVTHEDPVEDDLPPTTDRKLLLSSRTKGSDVRRAMTGAGGGGAKDRDRDRELRPGRESLKKARTSKVDIIESHAREYSRGMNGILGEFKLDYGSEATSDDASDAELDGRDSSVSKAGDEDGPGDGAGTPAAPQIRISPNSQGAHPGSHRQSHFIHLATRAANNSSIAQNRFMTDVSYPAAAAAGARGRHRNELRALKNYKYCIILPNDCWKIRWDLCISLLIVATAIYTPYRLAYIDEESTAWVVSELGVDSFFLLDMLFSFFSAYYDATDVLVDARRTIACNYLRGYGPVPGGLGISVVFVGALLAATTGIVGATVVAMGLISLPAMLRNKYSPSLATGTIAASGTLGQIIPPSIVLIILADQLASAADQASTARKALFKENTGRSNRRNMGLRAVMTGSIMPGSMQGL